MPSIKDSTVLVAGGAGNIGSYTVDQLIEEGVGRIIVVDNMYNGHPENLANALHSTRTEVELVELDIADYEALRELFHHSRPDYAFHLASMLTLDSKRMPRQAIQSNIVGTWNIIDCCIDAGVRKIVFSSSASVFGEPRYLPVDEEHPFDNKLLYGATKIACEALLVAAKHEYGLCWVGMRYYNVYSERQRRGHLYTQVIPKWAHDMVIRGEITINDDGSQTMDLIHAEDVARANVLAMKSDIDGEFFNVGTGVETSVKQLAEWMIEFYERPIKVKYVEHDPNRVKRRSSSTTKIRRLLCFEPQIGAREGVRRCVEELRKRDLSGVKFDEP